jgi:hypothetical protein
MSQYIGILSAPHLQDIILDSLKGIQRARCQRLMPVILAT